MKTHLYLLCLAVAVLSAFAQHSSLVIDTGLTQLYMGDSILNIENRPTIGVLTQPTPDSQKASFPYDQFILEPNKDIIEIGGSYAVPIKYDMPEQDLYELLETLNGVYFTGGSLQLMDTVTGEQHQYYKTAKKIFDYSKHKKDHDKENFLILGICQGFELLSYLASDDYLNVMSAVPAWNVNRPLDWAYYSVRNESVIFQDFRQKILNQMASKDILWHAHNWGITMDTYLSVDSLQKFFKVIATDTLETNNLEFLTVMEAHHYPIYAVMFHPEHHIMRLFDKETNTLQPLYEQEITGELALEISQFIQREASKSHHKFPNKYNLYKKLLQRKPLGDMPYGDQFYTKAYGIN